MEKARADAAAAIFKAKNSGYGKDQMDLHGLYVNEALSYLSDRLDATDELLRKGELELTIITGAGHHTEQGKARIKPEVIKLLHERGYPFTEQPGGGILIVSFGEKPETIPTHPTSPKTKPQHRPRHVKKKSRAVGG